MIFTPLLRQRGAKGRVCLYYRAAPCLHRATDSMEWSCTPQAISEVHCFFRFLEMNHNPRRRAQIVLRLIVGSSL